jgi:hypothetical protein
MRPGVTPGSDRGNDTSTAAGSATVDDVVGEARWPMAGAVLAAMVLTILLPDEVRLGPQWLLPLVEGVLLVAAIAGDPGRINRRSRELRVLSIVLVSVLVLDALWRRCSWSTTSSMAARGFLLPPDRTRAPAAARLTRRVGLGPARNERVDQQTRRRHRARIELTIRNSRSAR